jgi:acetylornithine deacetylase/succinyl-diaminopimelate desuccinylase-like protein
MHYDPNVRVIPAIALIGVLAGAGARAQDPAGVSALAASPAVRELLDHVRDEEPSLIEEQVRFCEVPAPPFGETARGLVLKEAFERAGLQHVRVDRVGNVIGDHPGESPTPRLVVSAHLDTVFPEGTDVTVRRENGRLHGPGIADNCRGLAVLMAIARTLTSGAVPTGGPVTLVADVGEEGLGDLRGMKALFGETMKGEIDRFVSIDGAGLDIVFRAVGSHRYRVTFHGPGGHSFGAFGLANPAGALGRAIAKIQELRVPRDPRTTFNVGRIGGGTSVNAIPAESWMELDLRSSDPAALADLDARAQAAIDEAVREENARWGRAGAVTVERQLVGDRPAGATRADAPIVQTAVAVSEALGLDVRFGEGSTDANLAMSLNIPAITIGGGGDATGGHSPQETFDPTGSWRGTQRAILLTLALSH